MAFYEKAKPAIKPPSVRPNTQARIVQPAQPRKPQGVVQGVLGANVVRPPRPGSVPGSFTGSEPKAGMYQPSAINYKYSPNVAPAPPMPSFSDLLMANLNKLISSTHLASNQWLGGTGGNIKRGISVIKTKGLW